MHKRRFLLIMPLALFVLVACQRSGEAFSSEPRIAPVEPEADFAVAGGEAEETGFASNALDLNNSGKSVPAAQAQEQLIIRTGDLSIIVEDTEETLADITSLAEGSGGWVVSSNVSQIAEGAARGVITIRVPAEGFVQTIETIKGMALEVSAESTSGDDVTDEYVDLSSRLGNLEATAARVRNFLDETKNVEEALAVNAELSRLEEQIEVIKGRMQYLEQSAAFSTITVSMTPDELSQPIEVAGWRPQGVARDAVKALIGALQGLAGILIWVVILLVPLMLLFAVPLWLTIRFVVRRRRRNQVTSEA